MEMLQFALVLSAVNKISPVIRNIEGRFEGLRAKIDKVREVSDRFGRDMLIAGTAAAAAIQQPIAAFAELEDASTRLRSSLMDRSGVAAGFGELDALAKKLGNRLPGTTADFYEMFDVLVRKGVPARTILAGVGEAAAYLGVVLKMPYTQAAELAAGLQKSLGIAERDMLGFMDTIQRAVYLGIDPRDMEYAFARSGGALKALSLQGKASADALAPLFAMLIPVTASGETAGSGLSSILRQAMDAGNIKSANKELAKFGMSMRFVDKAGNFAGIENMLAQMEKLRGLSQSDRMDVLTALFGNSSEALAVASTLMEQGVGGYRKVIERMQAQADLNKRVAVNLQTLTNVWDAATGTFRTMLADFAGAMGPELKATAQWFNDVSASVGAFIKEWPNLSKWIGLGVVAFAVLSISLGAAGLALAGVLRYVALVAPILGWFFRIGKAIAPVISGLAWLFRLLGVAILKNVVQAVLILGRALMANPIGLAIAVIAGGAYLIYKNWDKLKGWFGQFWEWIKTKAVDVGAILMKVLLPLRAAKWLVDHAVKITAPPASRPRAPSVSGAGQQRVGGTVHVKIDSEGRARVHQVRSDNPRVQVQADVGRTMVMP